MIDHQIICPYTGLRSFTEEESLYFKGRDLQVDQLTALLEQNKFLMVTGASGEGKSSLIYAGLIPNARAGFFKARYTNWVIADFRPERSPVKNMSKALAGTFGTEISTIETELRRGFSSLIDLYTNSEYYVDENDESWTGLGNEAKKERKRKTANLMIIVDQFEEFFTNPENFYNEIPSQDSQIVVNLVLETARIAIKKNLPVYIVCTMRSDYIGQCSAFRGLPEYIGFSQFFVPRLKRKDLKQVIEEPAILSGNRISQRLIERLVYDIAEGVDQLPILQHALAQIWLMADHGREEMDLVHYAMVGGMPANELPDEDKAKFNHWFSSLPSTRKKYYQETGLSKVIEIHASILYETAWEYYNKEHPLTPITQKDAKRIIALTFSCLTKIDNSRAVRNRMTLGEITGIINTPHLTSDVIAGVLSIYREEGNSFIRPFRTSDPATHKIHSNTVLDITHESLIRNWNKLNSWANREFEFYSTYLDFKKQMDRWQQSGKSNGFLLPIGPLTFFENWYNQCKPNIGWIKRYSEIKDGQTNTDANAEKILANTKEFIKRSARKVALPRAFMKYGPQRIAVLLAILIMILLIGYYWYDAELKQNNRIITKVRTESKELFKSEEIGYDIKAIPILIEERYSSGSLLPYLEGLPKKEAVGLGNEVYKQMLIFNKHDTSVLKNDLKQLLEANFRSLINQNTDHATLIKGINDFTTLLAYEQYYVPSSLTSKMLEEMADHSYDLALVFFRNTDLFTSTISPEINYGIQQWLTFGNVTTGKLKEVLDLFSPFEGKGGERIFNTYYSKGSYEINGRTPNDFNSGYHTLASLYAATGTTEKVIQCFDFLKQDGQNDYFTGSLFNNYNHILAILYQFGYRDKAGDVVKWLGNNYATNTPITIYRNAVIRAGHISLFYKVNIIKDVLRSYKGYFYPNLCLSRREVFNALADDYEKIIAGLKNPDERNFLLAMNKKRRVMLENTYRYDRGISEDINTAEALLQEAVVNFRKVNKNYLDSGISITTPYYTDGVRTRSMKRRELFIYPDYMDGWFSTTYHSDLFFNFIIKNNLASEFYTTPAELGLVNLWIAKAFEVKPRSREKAFDNLYPLPETTLLKVIDLAKTHPLGQNLDLNLVYMVLANRSFENGDTTGGIRYYHLFNKDDFAASRDRFEYVEKTFFLNQLKDLCVNLSLAGHKNEAVELAEKFQEEHEKVFAYLALADKIYRKGSDPSAFVYLDSAFSKSRNVDYGMFNFGSSQALDFRFYMILTLSKIGGKELNRFSENYLTEIIQFGKFTGILSRVMGVAEEGNFYLAKTSIPRNLTEPEELIARAMITWQACKKKESKEERMRWVAMDQYLDNDFNYVFYIPI